jgi:hypothetical protein
VLLLFVAQFDNRKLIFFYSLRVGTKGAKGLNVLLNSYSKLKGSSFFLVCININISCHAIIMHGANK